MMAHAGNNDRLKSFTSKQTSEWENIAMSYVRLDELVDAGGTSSIQLSLLLHLDTL